MQDNKRIGVNIITNDSEKVQSYNGDNQSLRRLTLLRNQLASNPTSSKYTIQDIVKNKDGSINIGDDLIGYPIVIPYDNEKPILKTEQQERDYQLLKDLFLNPDVMKTSSFNSGKPLSEEQFILYIKKVTRRENGADSPYGFFRIHDRKLCQDVGVQGMIDLMIKHSLDDNKIVESLTFIKKEYIRKGYGRTLIDSFFKYFEKILGDHIVYTIGSQNPMTHKICTNHTPIHLDVIRGEGDKWTNLFTVDYPLAKNKKLVDERIKPIFENKFNKKTTSNVEKLEAKRLSDKKDPTPKL